jgi:hypothetical protein
MGKEQGVGFRVSSHRVPQQEYIWILLQAPSRPDSRPMFLYTKDVDRYCPSSLHLIIMSISRTPSLLLHLPQSILYLVLLYVIPPFQRTVQPG